MTPLIPETPDTVVMAKHVSLTDDIRRMFKKLENEGYHGGYHDDTIKQFEREIHNLYWGVIKNEVSYPDYYSKLKEYYLYYKAHALNKAQIMEIMKVNK